MTPHPATLAACARGETTLAEAFAVSAEALGAARRLAHDVARGGREDLARVLLRGCVHLDPSDLWSLCALAELSLRAGDADTGRWAAARAAGLPGGDGRAELLAGRACLAQGQREEAARWLTVAAGSGTPRVRRAASALARWAR